MFWAIYILSSLFLSYCLIKLISTKYRVILFILLLTLFLTPSQIETGSNFYAPAIFLFFYNVTLELDFSFRPLRPLVLSIPMTLFISLFLLMLKRRLF